MQRIFIVGCPRSGTTLVQAMLARHPDVLSLPETAFFEHLYGDVRRRWGDRDAGRHPRLRHRLGFAHQQARTTLATLRRSLSPAPALPRWSLRTKGCARRFVGLLDARATAAGCSSWVEKTPSHLLYIPEIERAVPDALFVHVIRPGEDVLASIADASLRYEHLHAFGGGTALWSRRWNHAAEIHRACAHKPRHHMIFLDDLVGDAASEWRRLCAFLRIDATLPCAADGAQPVANLAHEPWKRDAVAGRPGRLQHKAAGLFGPSVREWLRRQLFPYDELRRSCKGDEPRFEGRVSRLLR